MQRGIGTPENREVAFMLYAQSGGRDVHGILKRLREEHGIKISANTYYAWKREGEWEKRIEGQNPTFEERTLIRMMGLIEAIERRIAGGRSLNPQDVYAYTSMVNTFFRHSKRLRPAMRVSPEEMRRKTEEILQEIYGIEPDRAHAIAYQNAQAKGQDEK